MSVNELEKYIFTSKYARWIPEKKRREKWSETCDRIEKMMYEKYQDKPEVFDDIKWAYSLMREKKVVGSQRITQFGGKPVLDTHSRAYNCLDKYTKFITSHGVKSFADFKDGDIITVLTHKGNWKKAVVRYYGMDDLYEISVKSGILTVKILATKNHRWILKDGKVTNTLKIGDKLYPAPDEVSEYGYIFRVTNITEKPVKNDEVWCLEVEDDHSFILPEGIVTGNCTSSYIDRLRFFQEAFHNLLAGSGTGASVQKHHIAKLLGEQTKGG